MISVYFYDIQTHNSTRVSSFHAAAPVQSTGETGGRCGGCGRHQIPPFLRQSELVQIDAVGFCESAATTRATSSETGRPGWSPVSDWTRYSMFVSRDNPCFCTHLPFLSSPIFFFFCTRLAKKWCFILSCELPISLSHWRCTELFFVCREHSTAIVWCNNNN